MIREHQLAVETISELSFPEVNTPTKYFRLLLAADLSGVPTADLVAFSRQLIARGIVYFCAWGPDCERMHDCLDEEVVAAEIAGRLPASPMTTWHANESLEDATIFFRDAARPEDKYEAESYCWVVLALRNDDWTAAMRLILLG